MRASLARWMGEADALRLLDHFSIAQVPADLWHLRTRIDDFYTSLVGELFEGMRLGYTDNTDWARLGNALAQFAAPDRVEANNARGIAGNDARLFAAGAFYLGGFPASAYLTLKGYDTRGGSDAALACFDLLARPAQPSSPIVRRIQESLRAANAGIFGSVLAEAVNNESATLPLGPNEWIPARLLHLLLKRFETTNIRAVLPDGNSPFWNPLVSSLLDRSPPAWEFFPSQIRAIQSGLLEREQTFSLQMPTGAGKTALCETLLYWHLNRHPLNLGILLVPYRSLASELRSTVVKRLNGMGISARCAYGGTVPSGDEVHGLDQLRALIATPETLSGLFSADSSFLRRVSMVICDEGHLLDSASRGVGLELLLARLKARETGAPRFVFVSAIVPNIEEINAWLGGTNDSVVRSDYRPALAEFALLSANGTGTARSVTLMLHPHELPPIRFSIESFLGREDFQWINPATRRIRTLSYASVKTVAVAAARKALPMGAVAVFAANKRGAQGAIGIGEELIDQLEHPTRLPEPLTFANAAKLQAASEYLRLEYGDGWVGTRALAKGAILHHGDIPQETREVLEELLRQGDLRLAICTNTLAEGVNLPIRTIVLYSIQRRQRTGGAEDLLARDIKNLVGRAGRAGSTTKGLVICANEDQWHLLEPIVRQAPVEPVLGALRPLIDKVRQALALRNRQLTNEALEATTRLHTLVDGIDSTLIDLAAVEIGEDQLVELASHVADHTFAARQLDDASKTVLKTVFELRARKIVQIRAAGRLGWIRETGARARMLDVIETRLFPLRPTWDDIMHPTEPGFVRTMLDWAWTQGEVTDSVRDAYRLKDEIKTDTVKASFFACVTAWLAGKSFRDIATAANLNVDHALGVHAGTITFVLQTVVEQAIALLAKLLESRLLAISPAVSQFPDHLRFGVPTTGARILASLGLRHRSAAVALGGMDIIDPTLDHTRGSVFPAVRPVLERDAEQWRNRLGRVVFENTLRDLSLGREHGL